MVGTLGECPQKHRGHSPSKGYHPWNLHAATAGAAAVAPKKGKRERKKERKKEGELTMTRNVPS